MKYIVFLLSFIMSYSLLTYEDIIQEIIYHTPYLEKIQVQSFSDLRLIRDNKLVVSILHNY